MVHPIIPALDFDGVICDSAIETAITGWIAAGKIWRDMPACNTPSNLIDQFRLVRPNIETGYEAILAMRLLFLGESGQNLAIDYQNKTEQLMLQTQVNIEELKDLFGKTRDEWINNDFTNWLNMNPLFPGIREKLQQLSQKHIWYVITTKQERFVKHILKANQIDLAENRIFGLDRNISKPEVLKMLSKIHSIQQLHFLEDRLPALLKVKNQPELSKVKLAFALWGYNSNQDKQLAAAHGFPCLNLEDFLLLTYEM